MNKNKIIEYLYSNYVVRKYGYKQLKKFNSDKQDDLVSEVWLHICELSEDILLDLWKQGKDNLTAYIKRYVENQLSPTGQTRKLQKILTTDIPVDLDDEITKEDNDEIPTKKFLIDNDLDIKLKIYEERN